MDKILTRIRLITEELYLVRDELNRRTATQSSELSSALFEGEASNELIAFKSRSRRTSSIFVAMPPGVPRQIR